MAFALVALLFGLAPGPDVMLVLRHSLVRGARDGVAVALGATTGGLTWGLAAVLGLATLVQQSPAVYEVLKLSGAVYLVVLGVRGILQARSAAAEDGGAVRQEQNRLAAFRAGLITDLLNPKMGVFYLALLPQFIPAGGDVLRWSALLMSVESVTAVTSLAGYAFLAHGVGTFLKRPALRTWLERCLGTVLIGLGLRIAVT